MSISIIACIIALGIVLIALEVIFIPGTTVVGFGGFFILVGGLYLAFVHQGILIGWIMTVSVILILGGTIYYAMKKKVWKRYSLQEKISGKVDLNPMADLTAGQEGITISALRPSGTAEFDTIRVEVSSDGQFIDAGTKVKIVSINKRKILVETR